MIIDTLVVVVCLMVDTPRIEQVKQPANRFTEQFQLSDSLFRVASRHSMQEALEQTKEELHRASGAISYDDYIFLKEARKELNEMKELIKLAKP